MIPQPETCIEVQNPSAGFLMALDAKVAGEARAVEAAQEWKKGLFADVRVSDQMIMNDMEP